MKLNIACGPDVKDGWVNVDKYPTVDGVVEGDITNLIYANDSIDTVLCNYVFEHLHFPDEKKAFYEVFRVLKPGGELIVKVPDFEVTVETWLKAKDEWRCFFKKTPDREDPEYGFGWGNSMESRWGVIMTHIFGSHTAPGLVHVNAYTRDKLLAIYDYLGFKEIYISSEVETDRGYPITALTARGVK